MYHFQLNQEITEIAQIQLVYCKESYNHDVVKDIDLSLAEDVCAEIESLDLYGRKPFGYPPCYGYAIKITYKNGEFNMICETGPGYYQYTETEDGVVLARSAVLRDFDAEQFEAFINKYLK